MVSGKLSRIGHMLNEMVGRIREVLMVLMVVVVWTAKGVKPLVFGRGRGGCVTPFEEGDEAYCMSWRLGVETYNVRGWKTVPSKCMWHIHNYMTGGQYVRDLQLIADQILTYADSIVLSDDGFDAWIFDVDDTCLSNLFYYQGKRYGCDPYDPPAFKAWAMRGECEAVPEVQAVFVKLVEMGFKVFLVTGRDAQTLGEPTTQNLHNHGFFGYERLIMRTIANKGQGAVIYKSGVRKQLEREGYRIWGNVGDQWTDLQGESLGNRTFKIPNPMYFVP